MKNKWKLYAIIVGCLVFVTPILVFCVGGYLVYNDSDAGCYMIGKDTRCKFNSCDGRYEILKAPLPDRLVLHDNQLQMQILDDVTGYKEWSGLIIVKSDIKIIIIDGQTGKVSVIER